MSSPARIGMSVLSGVLSVHVHQNGDPKRLGAVLLRSFDTDEAVGRLIDNGPLVRIGPDGPEPVFAGELATYHAIDDWSFELCCDYEYLWRNGRWWLAADGGWRELATIVEGE